MEQRENAPYIFISYARADGIDYAKKLKQSLEELDYRVFIDMEKIKAGQDWPTVIRRALKEATHLILVLTPGSNESEHVGSEVTNFIKLHKPVIPAYFKTINEPINIVFGNKQYIDFREVKSYEKSFQNLVRNIGNVDGHDDWWKTRPFIELGIHKTNLKCIGENELISKAHTIMDRTNYEIRHLAVTENGEAGSKLFGLLSLRQILKNEQKRNVGEPSGKHVREIMSKFDPDRKGPPRRKFNYLTINDTVETLLNQFLEKMTKAEGAGHTFYMSALPIVDDEHNAIGIISFKDICSAICTRSKDLPIPSTTLLKDIMNEKPLTATPEETISEVKAGLIDIGQRDAFIVNEEGRLLGMIPDHIMIENEVARPNHLAGHPEILVPVSNLRLQYPDTSVLEMLKAYTQINRQFFYFPIVEASNAQHLPKLLGAVSYIEVFRALLKLS